VLKAIGIRGKVATKTPVGVLNRAALPGTVRTAEVGAQLDLLCNGLVPGELAAVVVSDGAARAGAQPAQFRSDGFGCTIGIFAKALFSEPL
jgi:hypothetical protein